MNYPGNVNKKYKKSINYGNRGMDLENLINIACDLYLEKDIAIIHKKPTPIQVVTYNYDKKRITDAFYKSQSTLDYNGVYKGYYIEFDAKNTNKGFLPINNISLHQIKHIKKIIEHNGICFLIIMIKDECFLLDGNTLIKFINTTKRKSIPYDFLKENGYKLEYSYLRGVDFLPCVERIIKEKI